MLAGIKEKNIYKLTYTNKNLKEDELLKIIQYKIIGLSANCFSVVNNSSFVKIRNGLTEDKIASPK